MSGVQGMELVRGRVVRSLAGHDRGTFFVVLEEAENGSAALLCDNTRSSVRWSVPREKNGSIWR